MKKIMLLLIAAITLSTASAENKKDKEPREKARTEKQRKERKDDNKGHKPKFSKEKFKADMQDFIIKESGMTQDEADKFFPIYDEMKKKQRELYKQVREIEKKECKSEDEYAQAIKKRDEIDIESKKIQQSYNNKLMKVVPASKLFKAVKAEGKFHRKALNRFNRPKDNGGKPHHKKK